jgi:hypothetical protein
MNVCIFVAIGRFADRSYMHNLWLKVLQHEALIVSPVPQREGNSKREVDKITVMYQCKKWEEEERRECLARRKIHGILKTSNNHGAMSQFVSFSRVCVSSLQIVK